MPVATAQESVFWARIFKLDLNINYFQGFHVECEASTTDCVVSWQVGDFCGACVMDNVEIIHLLYNKRGHLCDREHYRGQEKDKYERTWVVGRR